MKTLFAICGSLRKASVTLAVLQAVEKILGNNHHYEICDLLGSLPLFNPDSENHPHFAVHEFRKKIKKADGVIIASPEYAHGVTGILKNGLDWIVGSGELVNKPLLVLNCSSRSSHADLSLKEILKTMNGKIIESASQRISLPTNKMSAEDILAHDQIRRDLERILEAFLLEISYR